MILTMYSGSLSWFILLSLALGIEMSADELVALDSLMISSLWGISSSNFSSVASKLFLYLIQSAFA